MTTKAGSGKAKAVEFRHSMMTTQGVGTGLFYTQGYYNYPSDDANLDEGSQTVTHGEANGPIGVHASIVASGAGAAAGGAGPVVIEVSGATINELGVRTPGVTVTLVPDITLMTTDQYFETPEKWLGTVTFTLKNDSGSTQATFSADFNYGLCKYTDRSDRNFIVKELKVEGLADANDASFDIRLLKHSATGWTYAASGFDPGNGEIVKLSDDYGPDTVLSNGENFAWDRVGINTEINGADSEGYIVEVTTGSVNAIQYANFSVGVLFL